MPRIPFILGVCVGLAIGIMLCRSKQARKQAAEAAFASKMNQRTDILKQKLDGYKDEKREKRLSKWHD